jgi:hypothetical protein
MITPRQSAITRIFDELLRNSRRDGQIRRATLKGGAELVVRVSFGHITLTIKRPKIRLGDKELETFRHDCRVPADAQVLTPADQAVRVLDVTWFYVTYRWPLTQGEQS